MLNEFTVNKKLGKGEDRTMVVTWLSSRRQNRHLLSSNRNNTCNQECIGWP